MVLIMNLKDIAKKFKVSRWTVSRVLKNSGYVKKDKKEKINKYLKKINYVPNYLAVGLAKKKSRMVCLVMHSGVFGRFDSFFIETLNGINMVLDERGYYLMTVTYKKYDSKKILELHRGGIACGFIFFGPSMEDMPEIEKMSNLKIPMVILYSRNKKADSFINDNVLGGYTATKYLIDSGYKRIAFMHGRPGWIDASERYRGFIKALKESNIKLHREYVLNGYFDFENGREKAKKLMGMRVKPDAIFASNDKMALGTLSAARELGMKVPEDIAIVGFDDITESRYSNPPLTTMMQPVREIAKETALRLIERNEKKTGMKPIEKLFRPVFIKRATA